MEFEWDSKKNQENLEKHGVDFYTAQFAFLDKNRIISKDTVHSTESEERFFCFGLVPEGIITVRFTLRGKNIRIYGAGFWREGKKLYEKENKLH
ncbi:BrnT family toxin [Leptospira sp. 2 VSF19]|uniref:BrnT family toxin n=1 Tax=Leptospira soteropolitanensis TaxID=2950025 RepID=A0AAW5VTT2_9LEPT|nr:BrnT family toxin [Leptospira soteropolitanensis]MCW7494820.1 BrnT family toxin [Leptospira soteropolitanensis]MCW7502408.1 BrnT family toxin [Leptospira soteropolitanensis]MCW7524645.1 BrnT family toxin [Leptospira soteropolitanensis]MCW7528516.1 BrnT family toxin [Leptospira soteropolitanensis]MCW7532375.1 BrnT family toxin [Leptospira soteropolitanensis]